MKVAIACACLGLGLCLGSTVQADSLRLRDAVVRCGMSAAKPSAPPSITADRIPDSQATAGARDIAWAWLASPTSDYTHPALGSVVHASTLHAMVRGRGGAMRAASVKLPPGRVIEDRVPRLADLDDDGRDEIIVVEADAALGAALVVYGLDERAMASAPALVERARSAFIGTAHRWLNPVGVADFDADGRKDIAAVVTPHIGGTLTLYGYEPPRLVAVATLRGVSNHRNGTVEQELAAVVLRSDSAPIVIIPTDGLDKLLVVRMEAGRWTTLGVPVPLPSGVQRVTRLANGACVRMMNGRFTRATIEPRPGR